ncbi:MAG: hypothetical protein PWP48_1135 [Clostridiales bacterium]|nr:hypothetical protein [Clostridiales bacterium]
MKIIRAETAGFCFGVRRAVDYVYKSIEEHRNERIYTLGPIIHNPQVVEDLASKGVRVLNNVDDIDDGLVIIRSHGAGPDVYERLKAKGLRFIDATCPYVARVHKKVEEYYRQGYQIIIVGEADHPEVIGTNGWCNNTAIIVNDVDEASRLPQLDKVCVVAQTTLNGSKWEDILKILLPKVNELQIFNTICYATSQRQEEALQIAKLSTAVIVIGGRNSSNTRKLYEICCKFCDRAFLIESADEIDNLPIKPDDVVGITAGASTPDGIIEEVITKMEELNKDAQQNIEEHVDEHPEQAPVEETVNDAGVSHGADNDNGHSDEVDFAKGLEETLVTYHVGQIVSGKVASVSDSEIIVSLGGKQDGVIPREEMGLDEGVSPSEVFHIDDDIEAQVKKTARNEEDNLILSRKPVLLRKAWAAIEDAYNTGNNITGVVKEVIKGGILLDVNGIDVFVPASHVSDRYVKDLNVLVGKEMEVKIIEITPKRRRAVGSHKAIIEQEKWQKEEEAWANIREGLRITGKVKNVTDFGAFVDVGGIDGLIHIGDLSWGRIKHPSEVVKPGDTVDVIVLSADKENKKLSLGLKQLQPQPWDYAMDKYKVGDIVSGKVVSITSFGAFVELEPGLEGLVHISQVANKRINKVEDVLKVGDEVQVKIMDVRPEEHRISLSIKEAQGDSDNNNEGKGSGANVDREEENHPTSVSHQDDGGVTLGDIYPDMKDKF